MPLAELREWKCKTCGEPLDLGKAKDGVIKCAVCDSCFTLPKMSADQKVLSFLMQGEHDLDTAKFEEAYAAFSKAAELDKTEPEAYWGMALAEFKIQYLKDEVNNRLQPICHEVSDKDFADSANFLKALRYATEAQRAEYERKSEEINYIKDEFFKIAKSGAKYDCFICVKVTEENKGRTQDYKYADDIYFELKGKGYKPFFSERELVGVTGADYEARILYALKSAECMLVVCFDETYLRTKWVKNEYTRFLKLVNDEEKESDSIALVFGDKPIERLPNRHGKIQGVDVRSLNAIERIISFVENHTPEAKKRREEQAKQKSEQDEALKKKLAEQEEMLKKQAKMFEQMQKQLQSQTAVAQTASAPAFSDEELLERMERARQERERKAKEEAERKAREERERKEKEEAERKAREESARKEKEEAARKAMEKAEAEERARQERERKAKEEAARKAKEEAERKAREVRERKEKEEAERKAKEEAERKSKEEAERKAAEEKAKLARDFVIENGVLKRYKARDTQVVIPDSVTSIGIPAFSHAWSLKNVYISKSVTDIASSAFEDCRNLESIMVDKDNPKFKSMNNCLLRMDGKELLLGCYKSTIPEGVTKIGDNAFRGCVKLTSIVIPEGVQTISTFAFAECRELTSVKLPKSLKYIAQGAFSRCDKLTNVILPDGLETIGAEAFEGCLEFTKIIIPKSVKNIREDVFNGTSRYYWTKTDKIKDEFTPIENLTIFCEVEKEPVGWHKDWNKKNNKKFGGRHKVVWGYKGK